MTPELFNSISLAYHAAEKAMLEAKAARFPHHSVVYVQSPRFTGYGIVAVEDGCPPGYLSVLIENGNIWRYLAQSCLPVTERKKFPTWIRRQFTKWTRIRKRNEREQVRLAYLLAEKRAKNKCPNDTDGDGDCHLCAGDPQRCPNRQPAKP